MNDFDRIVGQIRDEVPDSTDAAERVRARLGAAACPTMRGLLAAVQNDARRMLVDDHVRSCVVCRREATGARADVVEMPRRSSGMRWAALAAAAVVVAGVSWTAPAVLDRVLAPSGARGTVASISGTLVAVSSEGAAPMRVGAEVAEDQEIRTGKGSHAVVRLRDGSLVELDERSAITLSERWRGKTVRLVRGNVLVEAAKQRSGFLQVATGDAVVSVKGTIFGVSRGLKGSRVSVVEGEVKVDENAGGGALLHRGDQHATDRSMARTAVADDVAWSAKAAKYIALLADLQDVNERVSRIPLPGLRYASRLLDRVPADTVFVVSIPNLGPVLSEAVQVFEDKAKESAVMAEWWAASGGGHVRTAVDHAKAVSAYLGDEIIVAGPRGALPVILAEVTRDGLAAELQRLGFKGPVAIEGGVVAIGAERVPPVGGFAATGFGAALAERYRSGAGMMIAANLEQIATGPVQATVSGFDNVRYFIGEQKGTLAAPVHSASLSFKGARHGVANWLAAPGPMGSLEFVSKDATFAASFVTRDPRQMLEDILKMTGASADVSRVLDAADALGGEVTIAFDGTLLPTPAWTLVLEVDDAVRLQRVLEQAMPSIEKSTVDGRAFYAVTGTPMRVHYTYVDGYWLMGPNRADLLKAVSNRAAGATLPGSNEFRGQMPQDGHTYFSGLMYYNFATTIGPMADQLKASGLLTPQLQSQVEKLTANRAPGLVYVYGEQDRIQVGSRSGLLQLALQMLGSGDPMSMVKGMAQ